MDTVGIVACSNGLQRQAEPEIRALEDYLRSSGRKVVCSSCIFGEGSVFSGTGKQRAEALMKLFRDPGVSEIYDVSGGDLANEILHDLDFEEIRRSRATFWGYSDLTSVINAIYARTGRSSVLYQVRNLVQPGVESLQQYRFENRQALFCPAVRMLRGQSMEGVVVGGNVRCLLKLAGTEYFPDMQDKILLLEARSGGTDRMTAMLAQLRDCGVFRKIRGILLGTFIQMEAEGRGADVVTLVENFAGESLPIAKTGEIGHGADSRAIRIGRPARISAREGYQELQIHMPCGQTCGNC